MSDTKAEREQKILAIAEALSVETGESVASCFPKAKEWYETFNAVLIRAAEKEAAQSR